MKKLFALLLVFILGIGLLAGCSSETAPAEESQAQATEQESEQTSEETTESSTDFTVDPTTVKVGVVLSGTLGDESVHDQANAGALRVEEEFGVEINVVEATDSSLYADTIEGLCDAGYNVIACDAFSFADALTAVAPKYPDVNFMILDTFVDFDNVASFTYATHECSFLAGVAAASVSETGNIGFVGGMEIPTIQKFQKGFEEGVAYVNPEATVTAKYVGNDATAWSDPAKAKTLTNDMIANDVDVVYHAAGASGLGMIEASVENDIYAIGVNTDQSHLAPENVLTSAMTNGDTAIYMFVESYLNGEVLTGLNLLNTENGGVGYIQSDLMSEELIQTLEDVKAGIISGDIVVTDVMAE